MRPNPIMPSCILNLLLGPGRSRSRRATARLHTLSTVKPYSRITTSPGADAPKRSTAITSPRLADVAMPALRHAGLDREPGADRRRQHRVAVFLRLGVEQFPARHRDDAHLDLLLQQFLPRFHDQRDLGAGGDEDQVGIAVRGIGQDVGAAPQARRRRKTARGRASARSAASTPAPPAGRAFPRQRATPRRSRWRRPGG